MEPESAAIVVSDEVRNVSVLVVEDMALNQLLMRTLLDDFGYTCDIAANGKIAIEKLKTRSYDVILMDLQMPEMNGFDATEHIRKELQQTTPIIALTADVTTADLAKCKAVGMDDYVSKPIDERLLQSKMLFYLAKASHKRLSPLQAQAREKVIDLSYLLRKTKSDPQLTAEIISLYLGQTNSILGEMSDALNNQNWKSLQSIAHKMIPSFSIVGINKRFEDAARELQDLASKAEYGEGMKSLVFQLHNVLERSCEELEVELASIKSLTS